MVKRKRTKYKNNDLEALHRKLKIEQHEPNKKPVDNSDATEG